MRQGTLVRCLTVVLIFLLMIVIAQMDHTSFRPILLLVLAAIIWGSAFVAQKSAMQDIGPFWFTSLRFILASIVLLPLALKEKQVVPTTMRDWGAGALIGVFIFSGVSIQQYGIQFTSVTNSGFISGLYVVLVPIIAMIFGARPGLWVWLGVFLAFIGMCLLSFQNSATFFPDTAMNKGDFLTLFSTIFWALQVIGLSGTLGRRLTPFRLAETMFVVSAVLGTIVAFFTESLTLSAIQGALPSILYVGVMSSAVALTLQAVGQRHVPAATSALIISFEAVFAALAGWFFFDDTLNLRGFLGCTLMFSGLVIAQVMPKLKVRKAVR